MRAEDLDGMKQLLLSHNEGWIGRKFGERAIRCELIHTRANRRHVVWFKNGRRVAFQDLLMLCDK